MITKVYINTEKDVLFVKKDDTVAPLPASVVSKYTDDGVLLWAGVDEAKDDLTYVPAKESTNFQGAEEHKVRGLFS
jgi:hypothetical protein